MSSANPDKDVTQPPILTLEQDMLLDMYIKKLDKIFEDIKESENTQAEIETLHLKRLLST